MSHRIDRTGESKILADGTKATIIGYRECHDIDVKFKSPDGESWIGRHMAYSHFKKGDIAGKKVNKHDAQVLRVGEKRTMLCGEEAEIVEYADSMHIVVRFPNGERLTTSYKIFAAGELRPSYIGKNYKQQQISAEAKEGAVGATRIASNGQEMTIIAYRNANDIDIQFRDGTVVKHKRIHNFMMGKIQNPNQKNKGTVLHEGERGVNTQGCAMTIKRYDDWNHITVVFDDGTEVESTYGQFKKGKLENPNCKRIRIIDRTGEKNLMSCGLEAEVIGYRDGRDIDIRFEDGTVLEHMEYRSFFLGHIAHPTLSTRNIRKRQSSLCGIRAKFVARGGDPESRGKVFYSCICPICRKEEIWTPQEMMVHAKEHETPVIVT